MDLTGRSPESTRELVRVRPLLQGLLEQLSESQRLVFVLYEIEGYRHDEIAEMMDLSVGTSKAQLHRARALLRGVLA